MTVIIQLGTIAIALAGVFIMVGARKLGCRVLAVGVILIVSASALAPSRATNQERSDVAAR